MIASIFLAYQPFLLETLNKRVDFAVNSPMFVVRKAWRAAAK